MIQPKATPGSQSGASVEYERSDVDPGRIAVFLVAMLVTLAAIVFSVQGVVQLLWEGGSPSHLPLTVTLPSIPANGASKNK